MSLREQQTGLPTNEELLVRIREAREAYFSEQAEHCQRDYQVWVSGGEVGEKPRKPRRPKAVVPLTEEEKAGFGALPEGWCWVRLGELIDTPQYGTSAKCTYEVGQRYGVLRIPNITTDGIDPEDLKYVDLSDEEAQKYMLEANDLLVIRSNGSLSLVGASAVVGKEDMKCLFAGYLIRIRLVQEKNAAAAAYLHSYLQTRVARNQIEAFAKSTSGVNNINSKELQSVVLPWCSVLERKGVIEALDMSTNRVSGLALHRLPTQVDNLIAHNSNGSTYRHYE